MTETAAPAPGSWRRFLQIVRKPPFLVFFAIGYTLGFLALLRLSALLAVMPGSELWFPAFGLRFAMLLRYGPRVTLPLVIAETVALAAAGGLATAGPLEIATSTASALIYSLLVWALVRRRGIEVSLDRFSNLLWIGTAAIAAATVSAAVTIPAATSGIGEAGTSVVALAITTNWICQMLGILSAGPALYGLLLLLDGRRRLRPDWSLIGEAFAALALGALLVTLIGATSRFVHWYPALLPVLWLAVRHGWTGAAIAVLAVTVATIFGAANAATPVARLEIQLFLLLQAGIGLLLGGLSTSRARMAANLKVRETALAHLERLSLLGQMAASLAHEIAQPLSAISVFARAGSDPQASSARCEEALSLIAHEADRLKAIIQRTRALSQNKPPRLVPMDLHGAIADLEPLLMLEASRGETSLRLEIPRQIPPILGDEVQIQQVLLNLVRNAVDAVKDQPPEFRLVIVRVQQRRRDQIRVSVIDRGRGVSDQDLAQMFTPFVGRTPTGVGLGLAISRTIVEAHGGRLWAERPPQGAGLSLSFSLPVSREAATE